MSANPQFLTLRCSAILVKIFTLLAIQGRSFKSRLNKHNKENKDIRIIFRSHQAFTADLLLLLAIVLRYSCCKKPNIEIPLKWYAELRGIKEMQYARNSAKASLLFLHGLKLSRFDSHTRKQREFCIFANTPLMQRESFFIQLSSDMMKLMPKKGNLLLPYSVFQLKRKNNEWQDREGSATRLMLILFLCQHYNINNLSEEGWAVPVKTLLAACSNLPTYEEIAGGSVHREIIEQFEKGLNFCEDLFIWKYAKSKGKKWKEFYSNSILIQPK